MNKKLVSVLMVVVMLVAVLATPVCASEAKPDEKPYATVTNNTANDTYYNGKVPQAEIDNNTTAYVTVTFNSGDLHYVTKNDPLERPEGYAWLGVRLTVPADKNVKAYSSVDSKGKEVDELTFISNNQVDKYFGVSEDMLKDAVKAGKDSISYTRVYTWYDATKSEGGVSKTELSKQTVKVVIKIADITLNTQTEKDIEEGKEGETVWNEWIYDDVKEEAAKNPSSNKPADGSTDEPSTSDKDEEPKTGITATAIVATATVAMISLAGVAISKK